MCLPAADVHLQTGEQPGSSAEVSPPCLPQLLHRTKCPPPAARHHCLSSFAPAKTHMLTCDLSEASYPAPDLSCSMRSGAKFNAMHYAGGVWMLCWPKIWANFLFRRHKRHAPHLVCCDREGRASTSQTESQATRPPHSSLHQQDETLVSDYTSIPHSRRAWVSLL